AFFPTSSDFERCNAKIGIANLKGTSTVVQLHVVTMVFILGVNFSEQKLVSKALQSFYALGPRACERIMAKYTIYRLAKVGSLAPKTVTSLTAELSQMTLDSDAKKIMQDNIRRLKDIGSLRGRRHAMECQSVANAQEHKLRQRRSSTGSTGDTKPGIVCH
ncbi:unnamed protein product, partial [Clonostachys rosea f. rosea IK726]